MNSIVTNCHACHLEGQTTPALFATKDGDLYCAAHRDAECGDWTATVPIAEYLASRNLTRPEDKRNFCACGCGEPVERTGAYLRGHRVKKEKPAPMVMTPSKRKKTKSPWARFGSLGMNGAPQQTTEEKAMPTVNPEDKRYCGECGGTLRRDSKFDVCTKCRKGASGAKRAGGGEVKPKSKSVHPAQPEVSVNEAAGTLLLTEAQMVRVFSGFSIEGKTIALQAALNAAE